MVETSSQDGDVGRYASLPYTTKTRTTTNLKEQKQQPELPENQTVWKSDNQAVKETFIQTGRWSRDRKLGQRGCVARWQLAYGLVSHSRADKLEGTTGELDRPRKPGFQHGKLKPQIF